MKSFFIIIQTIQINTNQSKSIQINPNQYKSMISTMQHVDTSFAHIEANSPRAIFNLFNKTKIGQCMGLKCGKLITSDDKDHSFCNACWDNIFTTMSTPLAPTAPLAPIRKRMTFSEDTKKHDGQNAETTAFGQFFELTIMENKKPAAVLKMPKFAPYADIIEIRAKVWLAEYDNLWKKHPTGIVNPDYKISAFAARLTTDPECDTMVSKPKPFKHPVLKKGGSSSTIVFQGLKEHRRYLMVIRKWLKR